MRLVLAPLFFFYTLYFLLAPSAMAQCLVAGDRIVSGGLGKDGVPALTSPNIVSAQEGDSFLISTDLVLGVVVNGEARAYPHALLWWHEITNDILGGKPITVSFCPLTGSGMVYDPVIGGQTLNFGVSGLLFENNLILFDRATESLWSQMMVTAICGRFKPTVPKLLPVVQSTWKAWKDLHPNTTVLNFDTGFSRNYGSNPYGDYDQIGNTEVLFPQRFLDETLPIKEPVLGIVHNGASRAYPYTKMGKRAVINDEVNGRPVLVVFDKKGQMALPFDRKVEKKVLTFTLVGKNKFPFMVSDKETGSLWDLSGRAVDGPMKGAQLEPIATYTAMWFAWASFHPATDIYTP